MRPRRPRPRATPRRRQARRAIDTAPAPQVGGLGWPVSGSLLSRYGGTLPMDASSEGVLIAAAAGTTVKAVADGRVVFADWMNGYGLILIVDHGNGYMSLYAHNDALLRDAGDSVARRRAGQRRQLRRAGARGAVFRTAPQRPAGESRHVAEAPVKRRVHARLRRACIIATTPRVSGCSEPAMRIPSPAVSLVPWLRAARFAQQGGTASAGKQDADDPKRRRLQRRPRRRRKATASKVPLDEIRRYVAVYNAVKEAYVDPVDDKKLMQSAVRGLLLDLDPHSVYLDRRDAREFDEQTQGAYDGVGVELLRQPDVRSRWSRRSTTRPPRVPASSPATSSRQIDGKPCRARTATTGTGPCAAPPGSKVVLTILREGMPKPFEVTVVRERIRVASVRAHARAGLRLPARGDVPGRHRRGFRARSTASTKPAASCAAW